MLSITAAQARWHRLAANGLRAPFADAGAAAAALAGVQAQIMPAAGLALWNRTPATAAADLARLLYIERSLVKIWGQRGTLHLYPAIDWPTLFGALSDRPNYWERQAALRSSDLATYSALLDQLDSILRERGSLGRSDLRALRAAGVPLEDDDLSGWGGIFSILVRRGLACHAAPYEGEARIAHRERWLPALAWAPPTPEAANIELARRYLRAYGPATAHDLAYWRGRSINEARRWLVALADETAELLLDGIPALALRDDLDRLAAAPPAPDGWPVRLLGRFDPLLLGHREKGWLVDAANYGQVWRPAGHIEAVVLAHGRIAGTWRYDWRGAGLVVTVRPFQPPPAYVRKAVERQARSAAGHFGTPLVEIVWAAVS